MSDETLIKVQNLTMIYREDPVLWNINLEFYKNSRTAIVGPNGAGKSTLIKGILNLLKPLTGKVEIFDVEVLRRKKIFNKKEKQNKNINVNCINSKKAINSSNKKIKNINQIIKTLKIKTIDLYNLIKEITKNIVLQEKEKIQIKSSKITKEIRKTIAYIPQKAEVDWDFPTTVFDVVLMGRYAHLGYFRRPKHKDKTIALEALKKMDMLDFKNRQISELSGGQKQRVFIARALAQESDIYIMDEPFQGIDIYTEKLIASMFLEFQKQGKTVIAVHHNLDQVEEYFDRVVILNKTLIAEGKVEEVFNKENIEKAFKR